LVLSELKKRKYQKIETTFKD